MIADRVVAFAVFSYLNSTMIAKTGITRIVQNIQPNNVIAQVAAIEHSARRTIEVSTIDKTIVIAQAVNLSRRNGNRTASIDEHI